jgi:NADH-quinone oxidoreductase subunit M
VGLLRGAVVTGAVGLAIAAGYALRVARILWAGEGAPDAAGVSADVVEDEHGLRWGVVLSLIVAIVVLGVVPHLLLTISQMDAATLLTGASR